MYHLHIGQYEQAAAAAVSHAERIPQLGTASIVYSIAKLSTKVDAAAPAAGRSPRIGWHSSSLPQDAGALHARGSDVHNQPQMLLAKRKQQSLTGLRDIELSGASGIAQRNTVNSTNSISEEAADGATARAQQNQLLLERLDVGLAKIQAQRRLCSLLPE